MYDFLTHEELGSDGGEGSSSWGWTSPGGREFVAIGQSDGAAFVEISPEGKLIYVGRLPQYSTPAIWREIRGYKNFMIIGSEAVGHYIQIFDMTKVRGRLDSVARWVLMSSSSSKSIPLVRSHSTLSEMSRVCSKISLTDVHTMWS